MFNVKECDECREDFHYVYFRNTYDTTCLRRKNKYTVLPYGKKI